MYWKDLSTKQFDSVDRNVPVIFNIASIEQHGPHLPVSTDSDLGSHFVEKLDAHFGCDILCLPTLNVCCSDHHMTFTGSLSVSHESFLSYTYDLISSVIKHGFKKILILNSHGGNNAIGRVLLEKLGTVYNGQAKIFFTTWWAIASDRLREHNESGRLGIGHAGEFETSLMLFVKPELVNLDLIPSKQSFIQTSPIFDAGLLGGNKADYFRMMREISGGSGVVGDPSYASKEKGQLLSGIVTEELANLINSIKHMEES